jgi:hypothetical protein
MYYYLIDEFSFVVNIITNIINAIYQRKIAEHYLCDLDIIGNWYVNCLTTLIIWKYRNARWKAARHAWRQTCKIKKVNVAVYVLCFSNPTHIPSNITENRKFIT